MDGLFGRRELKFRRKPGGKPGSREMWEQSLVAGEATRKSNWVGPSSRDHSLAGDFFRRRVRCCRRSRALGGHAQLAAENGPEFKWSTVFRVQKAAQDFAVGFFKRI